jgi:hypothetical protein
VVTPQGSQKQGLAEQHPQASSRVRSGRQDAARAPAHQRSVPHAMEANVSTGRPRAATRPDAWPRRSHSPAVDQANTRKGPPPEALVLTTIDHCVDRHGLTEVLRAVASIAVTVAALVIPAAQAETAPWTNPEYLYRYFVWGARHLGPHATDYERFPYRSIENAPPAYHFARGPANSLPMPVELTEGGSKKQVALRELLRSTGSHAFIVVSHDQQLPDRTKHDD